MLKKCILLGKKILLIYLIYALVFSITPYLLPKKITSEQKRNAAAELREKQKTTANEGNIASLIKSPHQAFNSRVELIRAAKKEIYLSCHRINYDNTTQAIFAELLAAADRGVDVYILADGTVHLPFDETTKAFKKMSLHPKIEIKYYSTIKLTKPWQWNSILHDKYLIIDDEYLMVGGRNMGARYFNPSDYEGPVTNDKDVIIWNKPKNKNNMQVIQQMKRYQKKMWNSPDCQPIVAKDYANTAEQPAFFIELKSLAEQFAKKEPKLYQKSLSDFVAEGQVVENVYILTGDITNGKKYPVLGYQLRLLTEQAKETLFLQTPYATGNQVFIDSLKNVHDKAVNVELLTNSARSTPNVLAFSNYFAHRMDFLKTGITIREYQSEDSLHDKLLAIDNHLTILGSFNMDDRSLYIDTETMIAIESRSFAERTKEEVQEYRKQSLQVSLDNHYQPDKEVDEFAPTKGRQLLIKVFSYLGRPLQFLL